MRFEFIADRSCKIKTFLRGHGISKGLLARIKYQGGHIWVNGIEQNAIYLLASGDKVTVDIPAEVGSPHLLPIQHPLEIVAEDANFLLVNKPVGYASIPSILHSETMANFVKAYYREQGYENQ